MLLKCDYWQGLGYITTGTQNNSQIFANGWHEALFDKTITLTLTTWPCRWLESWQNYSTRYSRVVSHRSTNLAIACLTSGIGRDRVLSYMYGRSWRGISRELLVLKFEWYEWWITFIAMTFFHEIEAMCTWVSDGCIYTTLEWSEAVAVLWRWGIYI